MTETRKIQMSQKGQVTVFAALLFMVVFSLLAAQYRSALYYMQKASVERAARLSAESFLAGYNRPLRDYYQILSVDGGRGSDRFYAREMEEELVSVFRENLKEVPGMGQGMETGLKEPVYMLFIDGDWDFFVREITLNRRAELTGGFFEILIGQWKEENGQASAELRQKQEIEKQAEVPETGGVTDEEAGTEADQGEPVTDPRDFIEELWNRGILTAACPENYPLSEKTCPMTDVSFPEAGRRFYETIDFRDDNSILNLLKSWRDILDNGGGIRETVADAAVCMYIRDVFSNAAQESPDIAHERVLDYETEYILAGNESDIENLKSVLWKLIAFRCVMNMAHLTASPDKEVRIRETALLLSASMLIPQFTEIVAFLLKISWAFAEALADCRTLLQGGRIPILKDQDSWYLSWDQMLHMDRRILDGNHSDEGMDYGEYLRLFLFLMNREEKYRRMTNLMEKNIRLLPEYSDFRMEYCVYGIQADFQCIWGRKMARRAQIALSY